MPPPISKAMVLAAGYGTRLLPLTEHTPKPLVPVAGKPMLQYALDHLRAFGLREIVINVSHLKQQLIDYAATVPGLRLIVSEEPEPLETGGGLKRALALLGPDPFFAINSDIIWLDDDEPALARLARAWNDDTMDILLLTQSKARAVGYHHGEDHLFATRATTIGWDDAQAPYIIAGVALIHPRLFAHAPEGKFSAKLLWRDALSRQRLACLPHRGRWFQTGTPEDIKRAEALLPTNDQSPKLESPKVERMPKSEGRKPAM